MFWEMQVTTKNAYVAYRKYMLMLKMNHLSNYEFLESVCQKWICEGIFFFVKEIWILLVVLVVVHWYFLAGTISVPLVVWVEHQKYKWIVLAQEVLFLKREQVRMRQLTMEILIHSKDCWSVDWTIIMSYIFQKKRTIQDINIANYVIGEPGINCVVMHVGLTSALIVMPYFIKNNQFLQRRQDYFCKILSWYQR